MLSKISPFSPAIRIVSIGGGTGLSRLLSGLKHFVAIFDARMALDHHQRPLPASASPRT